MTNQENNRPAFTQDGLPGNPFHNAPGYQQNTYQSHNHQQQPHQDGHPSPQSPAYQAGQGSQMPQTPTGQGQSAQTPNGPSHGTSPVSPGAIPATGPYPTPAQAATTTRPKKSRKTLAGLVAVALLSAGVGGVSAVAANHYLGSGSNASSAVSTATTTQVAQSSANSPDWTATAAAVKNAVVAIKVAGSSGQGQGSGVVIDSQGHIVTNNHVVSSAGQGAQINVTIGDKSYAASIVGTDPSTDLAVLKLENPPSDLTVASWGDSSGLKVGQPVMAVGNPLGLSDTVTTGIVSALNRPVTTQAVSSENTANDQGSDVVVTSAIQTNAAINPGNSGGALVDSSGALVGITSSIASLASGNSSGQSGNIGIGFAIPSAQAKSVVEQLIANGTVKHAQIGVRASDGSSGTQLGAKVDEVTQGSPAEKAGLRTGDLITAIDGTPVVGTESLVAQIRTHEVGKEVTLKVLRDGETIELKATLAAASR